MDTQTPRAKYEAPKLEVQRLRELPSALAHSGQHSSSWGNGSHGSH
jgi:hypothetical protein